MEESLPPSDSENYGLTSSQAMMTGLSSPETAKLLGLGQNLTPEQAQDLRNRFSNEIVSGSMGSLPLGIGAIRSTPTGKLLGTVSRDAMELGQSGVENELVSQGLQENLVQNKAKSMQKSIAPIKNPKRFQIKNMDGERWIFDNYHDEKVIKVSKDSEVNKELISRWNEESLPKLRERQRMSPDED